MENKNKRIIIIVILLLVIAGLITYIVISKVKEKHAFDPTIYPTPQTENNPENEGNEVTENEEEGETEEGEAVEILPSELNDLQKQAYSNLLNKNHYYGMYFKKSASIDTITDKQMISFAISKYLLEKGITNYTNVECFMSEDTIENISTKNNNLSLGKDKSSLSKEDYKELCTNPIVKIDKKEIDKYISDLFNTTRTFKYGYDHLPIGDGTEIYALDSNTNTYYIGYESRSGGGSKIYRQFTKAETDSNNMYIYDKAFSCFFWAGVVCQNGVDINNAQENKIFDLNDNEMETAKEITKSRNIDTEYVFKNYKNIFNYKHTFKIVDGNYYWVSSEVVK